MPDPIKRGLLGIQSLLQHPDSRVMLVQGQANFEAASRLFPANPVLGWDGKLSEYHLGQLEGKHVVAWFANPLPQHVRAGIAQLDVPAASMAVFSPEDPAHCYPLTDLERRNPPKQWILAQLKPVKSYTPAPLDAKVNGVEAMPAPAMPSHLTPSGKPSLGVVQSDGAVLRQEPPLNVPDEDVSGFSHDALAIEFTRRHDDLRYCADWGKWLAWDGHRWKIDNVLSVFNLTRLLCRDMGRLASRKGCASQTVKSIMSAGTHAAVEKTARSSPIHAVDSKIWDADPWLLNTPNGIVDLTNGDLRTATPDEHMTKVTRISPENNAPVRWLSFLADVTNHDAELLAFLQRMAGYCLTGITRDHALFFAHGEGGNGKGTFLNTLAWIMGDYAHAASMDTFTETRGDRHTTELAGMMGARLVTAQETEEGRRWNEQRITSLTGGDPIRARFMRQDEFEFMPQFKLVMSGNHKPGLRNVNEAIRRRLHLIPFTIVVPKEKRDPMLAEKLRAEAPGILQWAIQGCLEWQRIGLAAPQTVQAATEEYLENQDSMGTWIIECCEVDKAWESTVGDLYKSFANWAEENGEFVLSRRRFSDAMQSRGHAVEARGGKYRVKGIKVNAATTVPSRGGMFED